MSKQVRICAGNYAFKGFDIYHDAGPGGTRQWVITHEDFNGTDNPLAFCDTLREARNLIDAGVITRQLDELRAKATGEQP